MDMKFLKIAALVIGSVLPLAAMAPASAATVTFDWTLTGADLPFVGSGTITAITTATAGVDQVTAITGTVGGSNITGLSTFLGGDELVFSAGPLFVDDHGVAFNIATGQSVDIFLNSGFYEEEATNNTGADVFSLTPAPTPLPTTWGMLILGLCGLGFLAVRGTKKHSATFAAA
jgi:hypothetical protein